ELDVVAAAQRDVSLAPDPDHRLRSALAPGQALDIPMADRSAAQAAAAGRPWWIRVGSAGSPCQIVAGDRIAESGEHQLRPDSGPYPVAFDGHVADARCDHYAMKAPNDDVVVDYLLDTGDLDPRVVGCE